MLNLKIPKTDAFSWWQDSFCLIVILGGLFFILLGSRPLFVPDEGRYAEIIREMVASGNYITPYLDGVKYFEKPVLFYWLGALAVKIAGLNLWSLRSVNALLGLFGCWLTYVTARKLYDRTTGIFAALILGTSILFFIMVHTISLDLPVTIFLLTSLYAFLLGSQQTTPKKQRYYYWGMSVAAAAAVLTKGLIGLVFPLLIIGGWIALIGEWRLLKNLSFLTCLCIFLFLAAPWHILVNHHNPEFFYFYFIEQHFLRYTLKDIGHYQPLWFFIPCLILGFFPWIVFLPQTLATAIPRTWQQRKQYKKELFFLWWAGIVFAFFSFSKSKLIPYILPVLPPLAILTAHYLQQALLKKCYRGIKIGYLLLLLLTFGIACALCMLTHFVSFPDLARLNHYLSATSFILCSGTVAASWCALRLKKMRCAIFLTFATAGISLLCILATLPLVDQRTIQPLAIFLKPLLKADTEVLTFHQYYQDLPFYLERQVSIVSWQNELSYGIQHQDTHRWIFKDKTFWQHWQANKRVFVVLSQEEYTQLLQQHRKEKFYLLASTYKNVLISNRP